MNFDDVWEVISGTVLSENDCLDLIRLGLEGLELLQGDITPYTFVEDKQDG